MRWIAAAATLLALLAAGCDDDEPSAPLTKAEYEERVRAARADNAPIRARFLRIVETSGADDTDEVIAAFREQADRVRGDRYVLDSFQPPAAIAREHQRFVEILRAEADSYECAAKGIEDAAGPGKARLETQLCLQSFYDDENHYFNGEDFLRAARRGGYDLGAGLKSDVMPDVPHRFLGSD